MAAEGTSTHPGLASATQVLTVQCHAALPPKQARLAVSGSAGSQQQQERIVTYAAEWYVQRLLRDSGSLGVSFSLARWGAPGR